MKGHNRVKGVNAVAFRVYVVAFRVNLVASSVNEEIVVAEQFSEQRWPRGKSWTRMARF